VIASSFVLSAASAADFPATGFPEIALVGRSNVGKSSLINALVRKTIARTSAAPGKTRLANYYLIDSRLPTPDSRRASSFYLVDLPGYGYARGGDDAAREFEVLTAQYFDTSLDPRRRLAGILHLIDSRHPELPQDKAAHAWIQQTGLPLAIIATKIDKLSQADKAGALRALESDYDAAMIPVSASTHSGVDAVWKLISGWAAACAA